MRRLKRGIQGVVNLDALADICQDVEWPDGLVPAHPEAVRLLEVLGVREVPAVTAVDVQALAETRDCVQALCVDEALPGLEHCRRHAPIAELRANGAERPPATNGRLAWTRASILAALQRWAAEHDGRAPSSGVGPEGWAKSGEWWPSVATVVLHFGKWSDAIAAAGLVSANELQQAKRQGRAPKAPEEHDPASPEALDSAMSESPVLGESPDPAGTEVGARPHEPASSFVPSDEVAKQEVAVLSEPGVAGEANGVGRIPPDAPVGRDTDEGRTHLASRSLDVPGSLNTDGGGSNEFSLSLALTGDFTRDAFRVRNEAAKLRAQAEALDVIASGIDQLAGTVA